MINKYSYAARVLRNRGIEIFASGKRILNQEYDKQYPAFKKTYIEKDSAFTRQFLTDDGIKRIAVYEELLELGMKIIKCKPQQRFFRNQKIQYKIIQKKVPVKLEMECSNFPDGHHVVFDAINRAVKGIGRNFGFNGTTGWVPLDLYNLPIHTPKEIPIFHRRNREISFAKKFNSRFSYTTDKEYFPISEIVIGVTKEGYIAAMPKPRSSDMPSIVNCGAKGQGKSIHENNYEDGYYHKFGVMCININDIAPECQTRCLQWDDNEFKHTLELFGEPSVPKPAVYLHPTTKNSYQKLYYGEVGFDVSLNYQSLLLDEDLVKYNPAWKMKEDATHLKWKELIWKNGTPDPEGLLSAKTLEEAKEIVDRRVRDTGMNTKMKTILTDIWNSRIVDVASGVSSKWVLRKGDKEYADSAWNICMAAGLFPYINTSGIRDEVWFALWLRDLIQDIIQFAIKTKRPIAIFSDEIAPIMKEKPTRDIIERAIRECRKKGIGFYIVSHSINDVPNEILLHADYFFIFKTNEPEVATLIKKYGLTKAHAEQIANFKKFECMAIGEFTLYDMDGNSWSNEGKPLHLVKVKPPNCRHFGGVV